MSGIHSVLMKALMRKNEEHEFLMNQSHEIPVESEDNTSNKSYVDAFTQTFMDFSNQAIDSGITTLEDGLQYMYKICPMFETDPIFIKLFPIIFEMELYRRKLAEKEKQELDENQKIIIYL